MHTLQPVEQHWTVFLLQDVTANLNDIIWPDTKELPVEGGMVQFAQGQAIGNHGIAIGF
jgi:hypothetical protein